MTKGRAVLAVAVAAALAIGIVSATTSAQTSGGRTLTFKEYSKGEIDGFDDVPPKAKSKNSPTVSAADRFTSYIPLRTTAGASAGAVNLSCTVTKPGSFPKVAGFCTGVAKVTDGTVAFSGIVAFDKSTQTLAVTGGTGAYVGARGTITSKGEHNATDTVTLLP